MKSFALCTRHVAFVLALALAGCGGDVGIAIGWYSGPDHWHDHPDWPSWPDRPQGATGLFPIAGDICGACSLTRDGTASEARFNAPQGIAADKAGNLYVTEVGGATIRRITPQGVVTTLAGAAGTPGFADGSAGTARFNAPSRVESDADGKLYVTDTGNSAIRSVTQAGAVATLAGNGSCGSADGAGTSAQFCNPKGIALDRWGNLFVADTGNHTVRRIEPDGKVSTLAGQPGQCAATDGSPGQSRLCAPAGIDVDGNDLYVADTGNATIRRINLDNVTSTIAGVAGRHGIQLGALPGGLDHPIGVTLAPDGSVALTTHNLVAKLLAAK
jgi:DNA-binding beta-propeller fold protein YncE